MNSEIGVIRFIVVIGLCAVQETLLMQQEKFLKMLFDFRTLAASFFKRQ